MVFFHGEGELVGGGGDNLGVHGDDRGEGLDGGGLAHADRADEDDLRIRGGADEGVIGHGEVRVQVGDREFLELAVAATSNRGQFHITLTFPGTETTRSSIEKFSRFV
ncbi:hypothetical protein QP028_09825 [Corynebacterium suedekumii]|nr:hypothetical protein QP028_09825 [Corynebacterium suedekumii]